MQQGHVGLIVQGDGAGHAHVHVGMTAVHGAGEHGGAGLLRHLLGQADGVEAVQAVGAVRAVLLDSAQGRIATSLTSWAYAMFTGAVFWSKTQSLSYTA